MALSFTNVAEAAADLNKQDLQTLKSAVKSMLSQGQQHRHYVLAVINSEKASALSREDTSFRSLMEGFFLSQIEHQNHIMVEKVLTSPTRPLNAPFITRQKAMITELAIKKDREALYETLLNNCLVSTYQSNGKPIVMLLYENGSQLLNTGLMDDLDFNEEDQNGSSLIHHLAYKKKYQQLTYLATHELIDINKQGMYNWTALHYASRENDLTLTKLLLDAGADKLSRDQWGRTPYKIAKERKFKPLMRLLK